MSQPARPSSRLSDHAPRDETWSALLAEIRSLVEEIGGKHEAHRVEREDLEKLNAGMAELLPKARGHGNRELLKWLIRALGQVAEAGLTAASGDRPDIREIHWQSDDGNGRWLVRVDLNRTFSLNLWEESVVSLDVLGDCTLYARELKEELADRASIVGLEVTAVPPKSLRLNMGGGMGFLYSQFVRSIPPDFYIESLTFMDDTVIAEGTHRDLGRPGKLELDVNTAQITEYGKEGDGSFKLRQTYDF